MSDTGAPTAQDRLAAAQAAKAEVETRLLQQQLTPAYGRTERLKVLAGLSGLVLAFVTLAGAGVSVVNFLGAEEKNRAIRAQERLDRTLALLSNERTSQRVAPSRPCAASAPSGRRRTTRTSASSPG